MKKVLAVPDLHFPFHSQKALDKVYAITKSEKPDVVIQLGDALDQFCFSKFPHNRNVMTPKQEIDEGKQALEAFWKNIKVNAPKTRRVQLVGNHDFRLNKRILELLPAFFGVVDTSEFFRIDGVETLDSDRDAVEIDNVLYLHGCLSRADGHMKYFEQSCVRGHSHRASVNYLARKNRVLFELECGWLGDETQIPFNYMKTRCTGWVHSIGMVEESGPRIILL